MPRALARSFVHRRPLQILLESMLIVHASSSCDICLEDYDWDIPTQTPHAIPCGHIFCKTLVLLQFKGYNL